MYAERMVRRMPNSRTSIVLIRSICNSESTFNDVVERFWEMILLRE